MADTLTLLFTDIVDSTQLNERIGDDAMALLWAQHDRDARELFRAWRGRELGRSDGFLVLFEQPIDALGFAQAYHQALSTLNASLAARVGLHTGAAHLRWNSEADIAHGSTPLEVDGLALPVAARVMSIAAGGQTLLTAASVLALGETNWRVRSHGHWRLKGVEEPVEVFEAGDSVTLFAPPADGPKAYRVNHVDGLWLPARDVLHTLPTERDAFVGRIRPLQVLLQRFDGGARLVSLLGIGGIGKTRLALRFAWSWLGEHPGGSFFCDLSPARSADGMLQAMAQGLAVPLSGADPADQLVRAIAGRGTCLLILDNAEQVVRDTARLLGRCLDAAPKARFVVTTREVLGLPGEQVLELDPLTANDSSELFLCRAQAASAGFAPNADDLASIAPLMQLLDGLPLAIELAAARVRVLPTRQLLARMSDRFRLLAVGGGRPDRQATLRGAFEWSWDLLNPAEKGALAQLSVFEGGFTPPAAEVLLDLPGDGTLWPLDVVQALVDKSLVRRVTDGRLSLLSSVQAYAAEHLATPGRFEGSGPSALANARARHWRHFASLDEPAAVAGGGVEIDNMVAACRAAAQVGDAQAAAQTLAGAWAILRLVGPFRAAVDLVEQVEPALAGRQDHAATAHWVAGNALAMLGRPSEARARYESALSGPGLDDLSLARLRCALAELLTAAGDGQRARQELDAALASARSAGDGRVECRVLNALGALACDLGHLDDAERWYGQALEVAVRLGDLRWQGGVQGNLGWLLYARGDGNAALSRYELALELALRVGDRRWEGNARCNLGLLHLEANRADAARAQFDAALEMARAMGYLALSATVLCNLGLVSEGSGDFAEACVFLRQAVAAARELGDRRVEASFLGHLARLHGGAGESVLAEASYAEAEALLVLIGDGAGRVKLVCDQALARVGRGEMAGATEALERAAALVDSAPEASAADLRSLVEGAKATITSISRG